MSLKTLFLALIAIPPLVMFYEIGQQLNTPSMYWVAFAVYVIGVLSYCIEVIADIYKSYH